MVQKELGKTQAFADHSMKGIERDGKLILIAKIGDNFFAIGDRCTHKGCKLSNGKLEGETVRCHCHGSVFNIRTGEVVKGPATRSAVSYSITNEMGSLKIEI